MLLDESAPEATQPRTSAARWLRDAARGGPRGKWLWFALALGCLVNLASLRLGLHADDYLQRETVSRHLRGAPDQHAWYELFGSRSQAGESTMREQIAHGVYPWWTDLKLSTVLFRPLSALTHYVDYALWPNAQALMHLHNVLWYALLILVVARLYQRFDVPGVAGALALLFYALDDAHAETVAWLAARNTIVASVFAVLVLERHHAARLAQRRFGDPLAPLWMLCALLASEGAIAIWGYLLAYLWWIDREAFARRLIALSPLAVVTGAWHITYRRFGFGVHGSGVYLDPVADLPHFVLQLPERASGLWIEQFGFPIGLCFEFRWLTPYWGPLTWVLFGVVLLALAPGIWRQPTERYWFFGCVLSTIPYCVFIPEPRLLLLPSVGGFAIIALWVTRVWSALKGVKWARVLATLLLIIHVPVAAALSVMRSEHQHRSAWWIFAVASTFPYTREVADKTLFILNTPNFLVASWSMMARLTIDPKPAGLFVLGASDAPVQLTRISRDEFILRPRGGYLVELTSHWVRSPRLPFQPGSSMQVGAATVIVDQITSDGRPAQIRVVALDLDSPRWVWLNHRVDYKRQTMPPIGGGVEL